MSEFIELVGADHGETFLVRTREIISIIPVRGVANAPIGAQTLLICNSNVQFTCRNSFNDVRNRMGVLSPGPLA